MPLSILTLGFFMGLPKTVFFMVGFLWWDFYNDFFSRSCVMYTVKHVHLLLIQGSEGE